VSCLFKDLNLGRGLQICMFEFSFCNGDGGPGEFLIIGSLVSTKQKNRMLREQRVMFSKTPTFVVIIEFSHA